METPNTTKFIMAGAFAFLLVGGGAMGAAYWALMGQDKPQPKMASGNLAGLVDVDSEGYEPSSAWIEDGLDPDKMTFDMSGDSKAANSPELRDIDGEIHNAVISHQNDLMPCYAKALEEEDVQGKVDMQFGIASDGHVSMVKITGSSLQSKDAEDCFVGVARGWRFPATGRTTLTKFDTDFGFFYE